MPLILRYTRYMVNKKTACAALGLVLLSGCAGTALPRAASALEGLKSFYLAVCEPPPAGREKVCSDGRDATNVLIDVYTAVNNEVGE